MHSGNTRRIGTCQSGLGQLEVDIGQLPQWNSPIAPLLAACHRQRFTDALLFFYGNSWTRQGGAELHV